MKKCLVLILTFILLSGCIPPSEEVIRQAIAETEIAIIDATRTKQAKVTLTSSMTPSPTFTPTITLAPTMTMKLAQITATVEASEETAEGDDEQVAHDLGVQIDYVDNASGLAVYFFNGVGEPIEDQYVVLYTQKEDLSGNPVSDKRVKYSYTENDGGKNFDVFPGEYLIASEFNGYNWGSASDVKGQANLEVQAGKQTRLVMRLGRLMIGFIKADGSVVEDQYVQVFTQHLNISDQWVANNRVKYGYTDNSGVIEFDLTPGNYVLESDFSGYNWGNAVDRMGEGNIPVKPGEVTQIIIRLGEMIVAVKDSAGDPISEQYVEVFYQEQDANGNPARGDRIRYKYTDNTGTASFTLTPGIYVIRFNNSDFYKIGIEAGKTTTTDGQSIIN